jgi:type III secretory pathway component EscT
MPLPLPPDAPDALRVAVEALARSGLDAPTLGALGLAWARAMPSVALVPAFGLRAVPAPARMVMGLALAASVFPALAPVASNASLPWPVLLAVEVARGLPVAVAAAVPLWAATMAGGLADALRGSQEMLSVPTVEGRTTPMGAPLSLLGCAIFLATGGPARVVTALALRPAPSQPLVAAANDLVAGITLAVALGGPLLTAAVVVEIAAALVARAASPAQVHALLAPLRALAALAVMALVFDRLATVLARAVEAAP